MQASSEKDTPRTEWLPGRRLGSVTVKVRFINLESDMVPSLNKTDLVSAAAGVRFGSPAQKARAHEIYARLRNEAPVVRVALRGNQTGWLVTRYADVAALLTDARFVKDPENARADSHVRKDPWIPPIFRPLARNMLDVDPPDHTRLRALVQRAFTPKLVDELGGRIETIAESLLEARRPRESMDLIHDYALPIPTIIIAEMLGVPPSDRARFHRWSQKIVVATPSGWGSSARSRAPCRSCVTSGGSSGCGARCGATTS